MVQADVAVFGEKDYQQLMLIKRLVQDLNLPVDIVGAPTYRDLNGLAMSSRNRLLTKEQSTLAPRLYQQLIEVKAALENGVQDLDAVISDAQTQLKLTGFEPEYLEVRRAGDLEQAELGQDTTLRILIAARLGTVRLIDNIACNLA